MRYHLKSSVGKDEDLQYFYTLLSQATILENNFFYYPVKHRQTLQSSDFTCKCIPKGNSVYM